MNELIVLTFRRPAKEIDKKVLGDDIEYVYDSTAVWNDDFCAGMVKEIEQKSVYSDIRKFTCNFASYNDWVDNAPEQKHFMRTGKCCIAPSTFNEDVDVGTISKTVPITCEIRMIREDPTASFDYMVDIDEAGQIVFTPCASGARFCDATEELVPGENTKIETVHLTAQMVSNEEDNNFDYFAGTDEIGQFVITPDVQDTSFLTVSVDDSLNLVTESSDTQSYIAVDPDDPDYVSDHEGFNAGDRVVVTFDGCSQSGELVRFVDSDPMDDYTGADSGSFGAWLVKFDDGDTALVDETYLTKEIKEGMSMKFKKSLTESRDFNWDHADLYAVIKSDGSYAGTPCTGEEEARELQREHEGSRIFKLSLNASADQELAESAEIDHMEIVNQVLRGDKAVFSGEGEPNPSYIHIPELTSTHGKLTFDYYYDPETDEVVSYSHESGV